jgi:hypothetical protein
MNEPVHSIGGIMLTRENWSTQGKICPTATLLPTSLKEQIEIASKPLADN